MDSTSEKKLTSTFTVLLCVYFVLLFLKIAGGIPQLFDSIIPDIARTEKPGGWALFYFIYFIWVFYGFWAVILALKESRSAIPALKLALPFSFFSFIIATLPKLTSINWVALGVAGFYIGFFIYLCKSEQIREAFPKESRRLGVPGYVGIILYAIILVFAIQAIAAKISLSRQARDVPVARLRLNPGEVTDGRTVFTPLPGWIQDSTSTIEGFRNAYHYHNADSSLITVFSCKEEYEPSRHYYVFSIYEDQPLNVEFFKEELAYKTKDTLGVVIFIDQYRYERDSTDYFWTYASKISGSLMKAVRISILEKDSLRTSVQNAELLLDKCLLNVRERSLKHDRIDKEDNPNKNNDESSPPPGAGDDVEKSAE